MLNYTKYIIRKEILKKLKEFPEDKIKYYSNLIQTKFLQTDVYKKSQTICVYLNKSYEVKTDKIIKNILKDNKKCYVPKIVNNDMKFFRLYSYDEIKNYQKNKYGILEPLNKHIDDELNIHTLDIIIIPGIAFDKGNNKMGFRRIGHGGGYYDKFLEKCENNNVKPTKISLAFPFQIINNIPVEPHDKYIDILITVY